MDDLTGKLIMAPGGQIVEVLASAPLLGVGFAVKLDMEGGRTGSHVLFDPANVRVTRP